MQCYSWKLGVSAKYRKLTFNTHMSWSRENTSFNVNAHLFSSCKCKFKCQQCQIALNTLYLIHHVLKTALRKSNITFHVPSSNHKEIIVRRFIKSPKRFELVLVIDLIWTAGHCKFTSYVFADIDLGSNTNLYSQICNVFLMPSKIDTNATLLQTEHKKMYVRPLK